MTNFKLGGWLLVALAIVGLAFVAPVVSAHGNDTTADDAPPYDGTAADWAAWMEAHMTEHMGVTVDEMAQDMADDDYDGGMYGQGHC